MNIVLIVIVITIFIILFYLLFNFNFNSQHGGEFSYEEQEVIANWPYASTSNPYAAPYEAFGRTHELPRYGWKIHVTPLIKNALKVLNIIQEYADARRGTNDLHYKVFKHMELACEAEHSKYFLYHGYQTGKVVAIYPMNDADAVEISRYLKERFAAAGLTDEDFLRLPFDFYLSPGVWTRFGAFKIGVGNNTSRYSREIEYGGLDEHAENEHIPVEDYEYPFDAMYVEDDFESTDLHYDPSIEKHLITERHCYQSQLDNWIFDHDYYKTLDSSEILK